MKTAHILLASLCAALACSCSSNSVDMPSGSSKGYTSARFVSSIATDSTDPESPTASASKMVEEAISAEFAKQGIKVGDPDADLIIAFVLIRQGSSATSMDVAHFGSGRDAEAILDEAHQKGVIDKESVDSLETGAVVIDLLDVPTNKLVSRTFAKRALVDGITDSARRQMINSAVAEALAPFFN
ncbi:MAG: DUF4136 domain-containing protein [Verrucomicrobiales bacterium]